nr:MAG: capsid protein [Astroviridae sp.]UCS96442.1 MAG: capsid protein [Astroviridae sp.]
MEQRKPRGRSRSRSRGPEKSSAKSVTVVEETKVDVKPKRGRSRSRSRSKTGARKGILKQSGNPIANSIATGIRKRRSRSRSRRRKGGGGRTGEERHLQREVNALKKKTNGPGVSDTFKLTATLGVVSGNTAADFGLQRALSIQLHPLLLKDASAGASTSPLVDRAKNYALWRCVSCHLRFMPFVNDSHVTGTLIIGSFDLDTQAAKPLNIDSLLARPYCEMSLGARGEWSVPAKTLRGPEEGWWKIDTNEVATNVMGPGVDIHTYGTTYNLLSISSKGDQPVTPSDLPMYKGPLCSVQVTVTFQFANWEPKPGLANLVQETISGEGVTVATDEEQNLVLTPSVTPGWSRFNDLSAAIECHISPHYHFPGLKAVAPSKGLGSTIWAVTDTVADAASSVLPGPWGWLIKNGYYFLRRIFKSSNDASPSYKLYASVEDAQRDVGCTNESPINSPLPLKISEVRLSQLNSTNVQQTQQFTLPSATPPPPPAPGTYPLQLNAQQQAPWQSEKSIDWFRNVNGGFLFSAMDQRLFTSPTSATPFLQACFILEWSVNTNKAIVLSGMSDQAQQHAFPSSLPRPVWDAVRVQRIRFRNEWNSMGIQFAGPGILNGNLSLAQPQPVGTIWSFFKYCFDNPSPSGTYPPLMRLVSTPSTKTREMWVLAQNNETTPYLFDLDDILHPWDWSNKWTYYALTGFIQSTWQFKSGTRVNRQPALILVSKVQFEEQPQPEFLVFSSYYPSLKWGDSPADWTPSFSYPINPSNSASQFQQTTPYETALGPSEQQVFYASFDFVQDTLPVPPESDVNRPETTRGVNSAYVVELEQRLAAAERFIQSRQAPDRPNTPVSDDDGSCSFEPIECPETGIRGPGCIPPDGDCCPSLDEEALERFRKLFIKSMK